VPYYLGGRYDMSEVGTLSGAIPDGPFFEVYDGPTAAAYAEFPGASADEWHTAPGWRVVCGAPLEAVSMTRFGLAKTMKELLIQRRLLLGNPGRFDRATHPRLLTADRAAASAHSHRAPFIDRTGNALKLALLDSMCVASLCHPRVCLSLSLAVVYIDSNGLVPRTSACCHS